ncbi:DsbC family protein [Aromatoleum anaerobium]|uniref:Thiol:disulfide interchange protein n=1 Tax=Aromatoleum anaerobium TaxID=182180 RepID=A0ABX1PSE6_9RHOO|nr:DsbC family protein [Aromatoleum anaerobium]MCK0508639.1 DsbC family protein [Aromatoleum anaerobium]
MTSLYAQQKYAASPGTSMGKLLRSASAVALAVGACFASGAEPHGDDRLETIKAAISRHSGGEVLPDAVAATPVPGIFEVTNGREVFYADSTGRYAFVDGRLVDIAEKRDLTQARLEQLAAIPFDELPLDLAIKTVRGNGARKLAVFEDPACPVCRSMQGSLAALDDVTIYTFAYPVVSPESIPAAVSAWCEPGDQRDRQWQTYMDGAPPPQAIAPQCEPAMQQVGRIVEFGRTREIRSTPTLVLGDGRRIVGAMPREELDAALTRAAAR